jgi:phosphotriesterase-related protein
MKPYIQTVLGKIDAEAAGIVNYHDHLITIGGGEVRTDKDLELDSVENAIVAMKKFRAVGGGTLVDMNPIDCGRRIDALVQISKETGVHIIACTGFQRAVQYEKDDLIYVYPVEEVGELIAKEILEGMPAGNYKGPSIQRREPKAGVIKIGTEYNFIAKVEEKMIVAAGIAHKITGAPISSHTERGTMGLEQLDLLEKAGVNPAQVILGHVDRNPDVWYHKKMAQRGAFLGYDGPSRIKYWPDGVIVSLIKGMLDAGLGKQILLGGDTGRRSYWPEYGGGPGHSYILEKFVPRLREEGVGEDAIQDILVNNPQRAFLIHK